MKSLQKLDIDKSLGEVFKEYRIKNNLTQENIAEELEISVKYISRIENGKEYPKPENFAKICDVLHTSPKDFYDFNHHETKQDIVHELTHIIHNASFKDLQFYKKVINSYLESK